MIDQKLSDSIFNDYTKAVELGDQSLLPDIMRRWCDLFFNHGAELRAALSHTAALTDPNIPDGSRITHRWAGPYHDRMEILLDGRKLSLEEIKGMLHYAAVVSAMAPLEKFAATLSKREVDANICFPGNHGGPADKWLVTLEFNAAPYAEEYFGATLTDAINAATDDRAKDSKS